jgi:hypothetical protein
MLFQGDQQEAKTMIERFDLKCPPLERGPTDPILAILTQPNRVQEIEEWSDKLHLPIMYESDESSISLIGVIRK